MNKQIKVKYILIIVLILYLLFFINIFKENYTEPCKEDLKELEYLEYMIPHHYGIIKIAKELQKKTTWVRLQEVLRKTIFDHEYEIQFMKSLLEGIPRNISSSDKSLNKNYRLFLSNFLEPNKYDVECTIDFFNTKEKDKNNKLIDIEKINEIEYIQKIIDYNKIAIQTSKNLLALTNTDIIISLCYRIINNLQKDNIILNDLKKENYKYDSKYVK